MSVSIRIMCIIACICGQRALRRFRGRSCASQSIRSGVTAGSESVDSGPAGSPASQCGIALVPHSAGSLLRLTVRDRSCASQCGITLAPHSPGSLLPLTVRDRLRDRPQTRADLAAFETARMRRWGPNPAQAAGGCVKLHASTSLEQCATERQSREREGRRDGEIETLAKRKKESRRKKKGERGVSQGIEQASRWPRADSSKLPRPQPFVFTMTDLGPRVCRGRRELRADRHLHCSSNGRPGTASSRRRLPHATRLTQTRAG